MLGTSSLLLLVPPAAKAGGSHLNTMLNMWEPLIMQELLIMLEPKSGRSWTSKVFNIVITLDTYQFITTALGKFFCVTDVTTYASQKVDIMIHS